MIKQQHLWIPACTPTCVGASQLRVPPQAATPCRGGAALVFGNLLVCGHHVQATGLQAAAAADVTAGGTITGLGALPYRAPTAAVPGWHRLDAVWQQAEGLTATEDLLSLVHKQQQMNFLHSRCILGDRRCSRHGDDWSAAGHQWHIT